MENVADDIVSCFDESPAVLLKEHRQCYLMVNAVARRVRQLQTGDRALALPANGSRDPLYIAQEEFLQDKLLIVPREMSDYDQPDLDNELPDLDALLGMSDEGDDFAAIDDEDEE